MKVKNIFSFVVYNIFDDFMWWYLIEVLQNSGIAPDYKHEG